MPPSATERIWAWLLAGAVLATAFLFGGTRLPVGADRYSLYHLVAGLFLALGGLVLLAAEPRRRPSGGWVLATVALPTWLLLQSLPLPVSLLRVASPATVEWFERFWPGALVGCAPPAVLDGSPGSWLPLALDPIAARQFFFHVAAAAIIFLAARTFFAASPEHRRLLLVTVAVFTAGEAAYGINQWLGLSDRILWATKTSYLDCATGTLVNRNHFAQMLYLGLGCSLSLLASRKDEQRRGEGAERETAIRVTLMLIVGLQLAGILASKSRGGLGGALLVLLPALPLLLRGRATTRTVTAAVLAMIAVPTLLLVGPAMMERVGDLPMEWTSAQGRGAVARTSLSLLRDFPFFGTGGGSFEWVFATRRPPEILGRYNYAHNDYLQLLIEAGALGLLLALAPVMMGIRRLVLGWRAGHWPRRIPLLLALLAALLHELVDFGFQIPSNAALFALLAGAALPAGSAPGARRKAPASRRRTTLVVAAAALACALPAMLHSIVLWPGFENRLPWPRHPDAYHQAANRAWNAWQTDPERSEHLCRALELEARAQGTRMLSAYLPASQARMTVAGITHGLQGSVITDEARDQIAGLCARARALNPWNSDIRQRLMRIALATGDVDLALEDALASARRSSARARSVISTLVRAGLPPAGLAEALAAEPLLEQALIDFLFNRRELETLREIVPIDVQADAQSCSIGNRIRNVLWLAHKISPMPFLDTCLSMARAENDDYQIERVQLWRAHALIQERKWDAASAVLADLPPSAQKNQLRLNLAFATRNWKQVIRTARTVLDQQPPINDTRREARIRAQLGEAYFREGRFEQSIRQVKRAVRLEPTHPVYPKWLEKLEKGEDPFPRRK